jgi:hypothetical protein
MMDMIASHYLITWQKHQGRHKMEGKTKQERRSRQLFCQLKECKLMHLVGKIEGLKKLWG